MDDDAKLLQDRARADERQFLINSLNPEKAPRIAPAASGLLLLLADQRWHSFTETVAAGARPAPDLAIRTITNLLSRAVRAGMIEKRGEYTRKQGHKPARDTREYRLIEWPES